MLKKYAANHERTTSDVVREVIAQLVAIDDAERAAKKGPRPATLNRGRKLPADSSEEHDNVVPLRAS